MHLSRILLHLTFMNTWVAVAFVGLALEKFTCIYILTSQLCCVSCVITAARQVHCLTCKVLLFLEENSIKNQSNGQTSQEVPDERRWRQDVWIYDCHL